MIHDLDRTLEALLKAELPPSTASQVAISFEAPDESFPPSGVTPPAIDLFLYDVRENQELRSNEPVERQENGRAMRRPPPARVDCSYLITAWPSPTLPRPAEDEHRLLGEVMQALLRRPVIPAQVLQGSLQGQELALRASVLQPGHLQSLGEFWQALGGKPRAALNYTVTIAVQTRAEFVAGPLVTEAVIRLEQGVPQEE